MTGTIWSRRSWGRPSRRPIRKVWLSCPLPEKKHSGSSSTSNDTSSTVVHWPSHWAGPHDASTHRSDHSCQLYTLRVSGRITSRRPWPKLSHDRNARVYRAAMHEAEKGRLSHERKADEAASSGNRARSRKVRSIPTHYTSANSCSAKD